MKKQIRHRRLHAFYTSKVLNALMLIAINGFFLMGYSGMMLLPLLCSAVAFALFTGYSCWLWFCKPNQIIVNTRLSEISSLYTLYFLIITASGLSDEWWYIIPIIGSIIVLFITLVKQNDEIFSIAG